MGRFTIKKRDTFIDMTPMSDVMVLLLTFFMLTATFVKKEPVEVNAPGSVSSINVPDNNVITILIDKQGRVFMTLDTMGDLYGVIDEINARFNLNLSQEQRSAFAGASSFGVPISQLKSWLSMEPAQREAYLSSADIKGVPCDSTNNEFKVWIETAKEINPDLKISIKSDETTSYKVIKNVMNSLQDIKQNRYNLITNLKKVQAIDE